MQNSRRTGTKSELIIRQTFESPYSQSLQQRVQSAKTVKKRKVKKKLRSIKKKSTEEVNLTAGGDTLLASQFTKTFTNQINTVCQLLTANNGRIPSVPTWEEKFVEAIDSQNIEIKNYNMDDNQGDPTNANEEVADKEQAPIAPSEIPMVPEETQDVQPPPEAETQQQDQVADKEQAPIAPSEDVNPPQPVDVLDKFELTNPLVINELREADARAQKTAEIIEQMKNELSYLAKKDKLTEEDAKLIEQKQTELMEKLSEFEHITTQVQELVGLTEISSKALIEQKLTAKKQTFTKPMPEESLPKVIICGGGAINTVPRIIVCEPTNRQQCGQPLYQQLSGRSKATKSRDKGCREGPVGPTSGYPQAPPQQFCPCPAGGNANFWGNQPPISPQSDFNRYQPSSCTPRPSSSPRKCEENIKSAIIKITTAGTCSDDDSLPSATSGKAGGDDKEGLKPEEIPAKNDQTSKYEAAKDEVCAELKKTVECLKNEMKTIQTENMNLKSKLGQSEKTVELCKKDVFSGQLCRADVYNTMGIPLPDSYTQGPACKAFKESGGKIIQPGQDGKCQKPQTMESMVRQMEEEVRAIQKELELVQAERRGLELQKKLLTCTAASPVRAGAAGDRRVDGIRSDLAVTVDMPGVIMPPIPPVPISLQPQVPQPPGGPQQICPVTGNTCAQQQTMGPAPPCKKQVNQMLSTGSSPALKLMGPPLPPPQPSPPCVVALETQLSSLKEQYKKLQCDYNCKLEEVSVIKCELESAKRESLASLEKCQEAETRVDDLLDRLKAVESEKMKMSGSKDQALEVEQQLTLAKQRYRETQEELEETRTNLQETTSALEEYRNKYLNAQQTVEEQRRQLDIMEIENNRVSEHINMEIKRIKAQFQEKLEELTPLPEMLKVSHQKLLECQQMRTIAERSVEQLNKELGDLKAEKTKLSKQLEDFKKGYSANSAEKANLQTSLNSGEKKMEEIKSENTKLRSTLARLEELALSKDRRLDEKTHEAQQLSNQLETLREESARQVSRTKDRCEMVRRNLQDQISNLERQLAQSRAAARTAQMDRDEIRAKMQTQIQCLNENFNQAQLRIRSLQTNVNYLKNSYTNIFAPDRSAVGPIQIDICGKIP